MRGQVMLNILGPAKLFEVAETILATGVYRFELDRRTVAGNDLTSSQDIHREVDGHRARMKQIQRPKIESAASQVHAAGGVRDDRVF